MTADNPTARLLRRQTERAVRAEATAAAAATFLEEIHRLLYPEDWMTEAEKAAEIESGYLNAEGIREWRSVDDIEAVADIINNALNAGIITPTPKGDDA